MTDTNEPSELPSTQPDHWKGVRTFVYAMGVLLIVMVVFGEIVPRLLFKPTPQQTPDAMEQAASEPVPPPAVSLPVPPGDSGATDAIGERLNQIEARLKALEDAAANPPAPAASSATDDKIATLQAAIDEIRQQPAQQEEAVVDDERLVHLEERVNAQEKILSDMGTRVSETQAGSLETVASITALGQAKEAFSRGEPFGLPLGEIRKATLDRPQIQDLIAQLMPYAENGVPTVTALKNGFEAIVPQALSGEPAHSFLGNLRSLVRIRKTGEAQEGKDDESVIARAEAKLERGDVGASVRELAQLSPAAATAFAGWVTQAQVHDRARDLIDMLQLRLMNERPAANP